MEFRRLRTGGPDGARFIPANGFLPKEQLGFVILTNVNVTSAVESLRYALLDILLNLPEPRRDWAALYKTVMDRQERVAGTHPSLVLAEYVDE